MDNTLKVVNAAEHREGYANGVEIRYGIWDFAIRFGMLVTVENTLTMNAFGTVYLSPPTAKALRNLLDASVQAYEKQFGAVGGQQQTPQGIEVVQ